MKRVPLVLAIIAALFAVALPAQAAGRGHRHYLGHHATSGERDAFGCGTGGHVRAFLLHHNGHFVVAHKGTVKHPDKIVSACRYTSPHAVSTATDEQTADIWCITVDDSGRTVMTHCLPGYAGTDA